MAALRRTPAQAQAEFTAQMKAQQANAPPESADGVDGTDGAPRPAPVERPAT
jgi:hypothetical protein